MDHGGSRRERGDPEAARRRDRRASMIGLVGWAVVVALALVWQGIGLIKVGDAFPSLSSILRTITRNAAGRWVLFAFWLWVGWHLFARNWQAFLGER